MKIRLRVYLQQYPNTFFVTPQLRIS